MSEPTTTNDPGTAAPTTTTTPPETTVLTQPPAAPEWLGKDLPEDLKGDLPTLSRYKTPADLGKAYVNLKRKMSDQLVVPGEDAAPEEIDKFYQKLGRPESPDKYELKVQDGVTVNEGFLNEFKASAHKLGFLPKQAQGLLDWYNSETQKAVELRTQIAKEKLGQLQKEWGADFKAKSDAASSAFYDLVDGDKEAISLFQNMGLGNEPAFIKLFQRVSEAMGEKPLRGTNDPTAPSMKDIDIEIARIEANPVLHQRNHPEHAQLVQRRNELYSLKYPDDQQVS